MAATLVLGVTAVLVQTPTARESYHPVATATGAFDTGKVQGTLTAVLTPARLGANQVRLRLTTTSGGLYHPVQLTATLTQDAADIGPLPLSLHRTSQGTYQSAPISLGFSGTWTLTAVIRSDAFDEATIAVGMSVS